jgi:uncharacterized protein (DUF1697 family)
MDTVRSAFQRAGAGQVRTFIQSGNVLFDATAGNVAGIVRRVGRTLRVVLGNEPAIIVRTVREIDALIKSAPFRDFEAERSIKLYVAFLARKPGQTPVLPLGSSKEALETVGMNSCEVFVVSRRKKSGFFGFPNSFVEEHFGVLATTRNWSTVAKIAGLTRRADKPMGSARAGSRSRAAHS